MYTCKYPCGHYTLDQRHNLVQNNVTTYFQLHFNVVPTSDGRWDITNHHHHHHHCFNVRSLGLDPGYPSFYAVTTIDFRWEI